MDYKNFNLPDSLLYNKDSSWVLIEGDVATVGVIEPSAKSVKEFLFIKLPSLGTISKGETYVSIEALKWSGHLSSPVSGEIVEVNDSLFDEPEVINKDPYSSWIMKVKVDDKSCLDSLFKAKDILSWLDETLKI